MSAWEVINPARALRRPEENPLLEPLGRLVEECQWAAALFHDPLQGVDTSVLSWVEREIYLSRIRDRFEPIDLVCQLASSLQRMALIGYDRRNPLDPSKRLATNKIVALRGCDARDVPWQPMSADGLMLTGCTGTGKSTALLRVLSLFPKVVEHSASQECGWLRQVQIVHLTVPMAASRGGLLYSILESLDSALGTSYRRDFATMKIDRLTVEVGVLLVQHYVGILVIEEIQAKNFSAAADRDSLLLTVLRLLNFGIPIVFAGNPLGFVGIEAHSQDNRRMTAQEPLHFMPLLKDDPEWTDGLAPSLWGHSLMPERVPFDQGISDELWQCCGGILAFARAAMEGAHRMAIDERSSSITRDHLARYRRDSGTYRANRALIEGFARRDVSLLARHLDVPWEQYGFDWGVLTHEQVLAMPSAPGTGNEESDRAHRTIHERLRQQHAAQTTTAKKKRRPTARAGSSAAQATSAVSSALAQSLEDLKADLESNGRT